MIKRGKRKALFLDRDGVINEDFGYVYKVEDCKFVPGIFDLCSAAKANGFKLIVVTNQAGIAKGYYTDDDFKIFMEHVKDEFLTKNCPLDDIFYCPYHIEGSPPWNKESPDRKPAPGMLLKAALKHNLDLSQCVMIGDRESDILAGINAGVGKNILINGEIGRDIIDIFATPPLIA